MLHVPFTHSRLGAGHCQANGFGILLSAFFFFFLSSFFLFLLSLFFLFTPPHNNAWASNGGVCKGAGVCVWGGNRMVMLFNAHHLPGHTNVPPTWHTR